MDHRGSVGVDALEGEDARVVLAGELRGTVWFDGDCGFHPEFFVTDGEIELHDALSWALAFAGLE